MRIKVENVKVRDGRRMIDQAKVEKLADSIKEIGLINPITLTSDNTLVAGAHRLEAFKQLGREFIEASVLESEDSLKIELAEIDENQERKPNLKKGSIKSRTDIFTQHLRCKHTLTTEKKIF